MRLKTLAVCGTGSGVGKSILVSAFCRIFLQEGYKVCPFKAQNMALNSFVTRESGEIGRAQAVQAFACRIEPEVDMNPVLIKPVADTSAQVIVRGRPVSNMDAREYIKYKERLVGIVRESFGRLSRGFEVAVLEGAGSPAEINLKAHDIVNMKMAEYADAPVILVGDIDKGGVFAWIIGTLDLLNKRERKRVKGIIINKFRGDIKLLKPGINFLEKKTGIKVLGVIPYFKDILIPEEDAVFLRQRSGLKKSRLINISVIKFPHISNFTDFDALEKEPDVNLNYVTNSGDLNNPDVIILPGTKNTLGDLDYLNKSGLSGKIKTIIKNNKKAVLAGICGGFQILGERIRDNCEIESEKKEMPGLGLLPIATEFAKEKVLSQVKAREIVSGIEVSGYEIHHGRTYGLKDYRAAFKVIERQGIRSGGDDGAFAEKGRIWGTYIHGVFDAEKFRRNFLNSIRLRKGWKELPLSGNFNLDEELNKLAQVVRENTDIGYLLRILKKEV